jgi:glutamine---fructose-6-phosphate transaminase (isomerizing)
MTVAAEFGIVRRKVRAMTQLDAQMAQELMAAPEAVRRQEGVLSTSLAPLVARLQRSPPQVVVTCARGSSAHAATYGKHLIERYIGVPVAAAAPSIASIYRRPLKLAGQLFIAISQSGKSADLIELTMSARESGASTLCITNDAESELARNCEFVAPMMAGPERSVPATKTFIASLAALARFVALWAKDEPLAEALRRLPDRLGAAAELRWIGLAENLATVNSLVTIGRGPTLAIAREAALKLKETSDIHAEAFSSAEFLHGPVALVSPQYPVVMFTPSDAAAAGMRELANDLRRKGAALFTTDREDPTIYRLETLPSDHSETDAICVVQSFYTMVVHLAVLRGTDVDRPRHLKKVTRTR